MSESVYDDAQTASDILYGHRSCLRAEMVNLTNEESEDLIKKLEKCTDNSHGPRRHEEVQGLVAYNIGSRMVAYPVKEPYAIYDKSKCEYEVKDNSIVISEKKTLLQKFLKVTYRGKAGVEEVLNGLESFDEKKLTTLQYELDMFREDFDDFLTPEQVEWFDRLYDIVASELDARRLLKKLEGYNIVKIERGA